MNKKNVSLFEIFLLMTITFALSFIIREADSTNKIIIDNNDKPQTGSLGEIVKKVLDVIIPSVSADSAISTCVNSKQGKTCQEYPANECNSKCAGSCLPAAAEQVAECKPGTCYDSSNGICQSGSPKVLCDADGGQWFDDKFGNLPQCSRGCCVLGNNAAYTTPAECTARAATLGVTKDFRPEVNSEIACLSLAGSTDQGACVFEQDYEATCKFTTRESCNNIGGDFYKNDLCSNPVLKTNCKPQASAACVSGKDGLYWFDSCGNRENIYSANKQESYNNGIVMPESSSCSLASGSNNLANQKTCGNCNYLLGSICEAATSSQKLADSTINFVCRDLSCVDSKGVERKQGESWCVYESSIGVDSANNRATDTVGSRQFRESCLDGDIKTESCGDYRTGICVQATSGSGKSSFSAAACRPNTAQECLQYSLDNDMQSCTANTDCFIKHVEVSSTYKFDMCAPKYPPGFDLTSRAESAQTVCGMASQTCTVTYVKKLIGGWKCAQNCECETAKFAQQLNNLCMSLGDCGAKVNYVGTLSQSYKVTNSPKLDSSYLAGLMGYKNPVSGKVAEPGNMSINDGSFGIPGDLGNASQVADNSAAATSFALKTSGAMGVVLAAGAYAGAGSFFSGAGVVLSQLPYMGGLATHSASFAPKTIGAYGGAAAGAAIGLAITAILIKVLGIGAGLSTTETYALLAAGTYAGAAMGYSMTTYGSLCASGAGCVVAVIVLIILVVLKLLGVGKTKTVIVNFQCQPWQAPTGGADCSKCSANGLPCSKYACESLGQTCELINEGTDQVACINNNKDDVTPPVISPDDNGPPNGYRYEPTGNGYKLIGPEGCLKAYTPTTFGITTDEPSQCRYDTVHTSDFNSMEFDFGGNNLFTTNHTSLITLPDLASLGLPDYNPNAQADYSLYVRCQDKNGNYNQNEYIISFCLKPGDDITPPLITRGEPVLDFVPYGTTQEPVTVYTNEPAECRWDSIDTGYYNMTQQFDCANDLTQQTILGWLCSTSMPLPKQSNTFYVRCLDQPWQNDTSKRNANTQSLAITLKKTEQLIITSLTPNNEVLKFNVEPMTVTITAETSGGVDGTATCAIEFNGYYVNFENTGGRTHSWTLNQFTGGEKQLNVRCIDSVGNVAEAQTRFTIDIDTTAPEITRVYSSGSDLTVITNENATCYFNRQSCVYDKSNATIMGGSDLTHATPFDSNLDYYLKCEDTMGNVPGSCSVVVRKGVI